MKQKFNLITKKKKISKILNNYKIKNIIIPGGDSIRLLLKNVNIDFSKSYFLTDERISIKIPSNLNIKKINRLTKPNIFKNNSNFFNVPNSNKDLVKKFTLQYKNFDFKKSIIIIGFGLDGHYCSIFKKSNSKSFFKISKKKNENFKRISITKSFIKKFPKKNIYFLGFGKKKGLIFKSFYNEKKNFIFNDIKYLTKNIICDLNFSKFIN